MFSTNAPFNGLGWAQVLREQEYQRLKIQELFRLLGVNDGDLNPGGGTGVSQEVADDGWGSGDVADGAGGAEAAIGTPSIGVYSTGGLVSLTAISTPVTSLAAVGPQLGVMAGACSAGVITIPVTGIYAIRAAASLTIGGSPAGQAYFILTGTGVDVGFNVYLFEIKTVGWNLADTDVCRLVAGTQILFSMSGGHGSGGTAEAGLDVHVTLISETT